MLLWHLQESNKHMVVTWPFSHKKFPQSDDMWVVQPCQDINLPEYILKSGLVGVHSLALLWYGHNLDGEFLPRCLFYCNTHKSMS